MSVLFTVVFLVTSFENLLFTSFPPHHPKMTGNTQEIFMHVLGNSDADSRQEIITDDQK